jgi:zinc protease
VLAIDPHFAKIRAMSKTPWRVVAIAIAGLLLSCTASSPKFAFKHAERRGVLQSNGMRFVIMPDTTTQLVEVDVHYEVGAREDPQGLAGLAHLVEHLMFQMRPDGPTTSPIFDTLLQLTTFVNAFTRWDMTHYMSMIRADNLDAMLKIEAMRMYYAADLPGTTDAPAFGCSTLPESEFERERDVVRNEIRAGSSADDYVEQVVEALMYPKGHAYERLVGGNDVQIASAQLKDACEFMHKYYAPERATLIIAGNVDVDKTVAEIQKWFGRIPKRQAAPRVEVTSFTPPHQRQEVKADVERPSVWIGWALPPRNTPEGQAANFGIGAAFGQIFEKGKEYGFAYRVEPTFLGDALAPLFLIRIELKSMDKLDEALEFAKNASHQAYRFWDGGTEQQAQEAKDREKASFVAQLEQLTSRTLRVGEMVQYDKTFDFNSNDLYLYHYMDQIQSFDNATIGPTVKKWLDWDKAGIVVVEPSRDGIKGDTRATVKFQAKGDTALANATIDPREAKHPIKVAAELKGLADAKRFTLDNGMEVVMLPTNTMPLATVQLVLKNTGDANTPENPALAPMAAQFLHLQHSIDPNMAQNTDVFSRTGISVRCRTSDDATFCGTHGVNIYLEVMVRGIERMVTAGDYEQETIEGWQKDTREDWKLASTQEENEYMRQVMTALYGPDHAYTKTAILTPDAASKIHRDSLDAYRHKHYSAGNATLIVVGNFDEKYAEKLIRDTFSGWSKGTIDKPVSSQGYKRTGAVFVGVKKKKEDQQVTVTVAYPSPGGVDGQEGARRVLAEMMNIRAESMRFKLGSTYGLYFGRQDKVGPTGYVLRGGAVIGGTIDAERAGETIKALRESLDGLRTGDAEWDEDFVRARRRLIETLLGESTVTSELASRLTFIAEYGLAPNYYNTLLQQIAAVSPAQVRSLIKNELDPANEVVVALGDQAHLDKTFKDAGITDVKIVEPDYK